MAARVCKCSHDKLDHQVIASSGRGACCKCICNAFVSTTPKVVKAKAINPDEQPQPARNSWMLR